MKLQDNFKAFCDGELSIAERNLVIKHLETNEADRQSVEDLRKLSKSIREYVTQHEPVGLEATLAALEAAKPKALRQVSVSHQLRWLGWTAAAVLGVGLIGVIFPVFAQSKYSAKRMSDTAGVAVAARAKGEGDSNAKDLMKQIHGGGGAPGDATISPPVSGEERATAAGTVAGKAMVPASAPTVASNGAADGIQRDFVSPAPQTPSAPRVRQPLIQKNAALTVKVDNVIKAQQSVESTVVGLGGWVQQSNRNEAEGETGEATLQVRLPVSQFDLALKNLRHLGDVIADSSSGNDVTGDVVDMDARLKVLRAEEGDYLVLLGRARRTGEIIEIRDKLTEIRTEIESITSQRNVAKDSAAFSTINVTLQQRPIAGQAPKPEGQDTWLADTWATAINGLEVAGRIVAQLFIFVLVWSPLWIPAALIGAWIYRRVKW